MLIILYIKYGTIGLILSVLTCESVTPVASLACWKASSKVEMDSSSSSTVVGVRRASLLSSSGFMVAHWGWMCQMEGEWRRDGWLNLTKTI